MLQTVEISRFERIEFMIVALRNRPSSSQARRSTRCRTVGRIFGRIFLGLGPAFLGGLQQPIVTRGDSRFARRVGEQIAGQLLDREPVESLVCIERLDHVIAIEPDFSLVVAVIAAGVGIADQSSQYMAIRSPNWAEASKPIDRPLVSRRAVPRQSASLSSGEGGRPVRSK